MNKRLIIKQYKEGQSITAIARANRCRNTTISSILKQSGISPAEFRGLRIGDRQRGIPKVADVNARKGINPHITSEQWAYIAGIFDGEGNLYMDKYRNFRVQIGQNGLVLHRWIQETLGAGAIRQLHDKRLPNSEHYQFVIAAQKEVYEFLLGVRQYCLIKQAKIQQAFLVMKEKYAWQD